MKTGRIATLFLVLSLTATAGAQTLRINSDGIGVDSGSTENYMNFGSADGATGYGFRDYNGTLQFKNASGAGWAQFGSSGVWKTTMAGSLQYIYPAYEETDTNPNAWVCIGNQTPDSLLHIYDFDEDYDLAQDGSDSHKPQVYVFQDGAGDASLAFRLDYSGPERLYFTLGIDQRFEDLMGSMPVSTDFKICRDYFDGDDVPGDLGDLDGEEDYDSDKMMMRIHSGAPVVVPGKIPAFGDSTGIVDFNQQSRARSYYYTEEQAVTTRPNEWTPIIFNAFSWDEHFEMTTFPDCDGSQTSCTRFIALEEGYYQVNARVELDLAGLEPAQPETIKGVAGFLDSYVSIAIFHAVDPMMPGADMHSQGNNLQVVIGSYGSVEYLPLYKNNAPNVSDIVHLEQGEAVEIRVWQDTAGPLPLKELVEPESPEDNAPFNYFSVHKSS